MGPDGIITAAFRRIVSGIIEEHHIDGTVVVVIVVFEIDFAIEQFNRLVESDSRLSRSRSIAIQFVFVRNLDRAEDVEDRVKLAVGIVPLFVQQVTESLVRTIGNELQIRKFNQNDGDVPGTFRHRGTKCLGAHLIGCPPQFHTGFPTCLQIGLLVCDSAVEAIRRNFNDAAGSYVRRPVIPLVTMTLQGNHGSVRLDFLERFRISRNRQRHTARAQKRSHQYHYFLHGVLLFNDETGAIFLAQPNQTGLLPFRANFQDLDGV